MIIIKPAIANPTQKTVEKVTSSFKKITEKITTIAGKALVIMPATLALVYFNPNKSKILKSAPTYNRHSAPKTKKINNYLQIL